MRMRLLITTLLILLSTQLFAQGAITGIVLNNNESVEDAVVTITDSERVRGERPFHERFVTEEGGTFAWRDLPAGEYFICASARGLGTVRENVEVRNDEVTAVRLVLQNREQREFGSVIGIITDIDGNPISEATVTICRQNMERRGMRERGLRVISDEDGLFTFEEVPAGNIMIQAVARGYMRAVQRIEIVADEATRVRIELSERRGGGH